MNKEKQVLALKYRPQNFEDLKSKFLEGDLTQMFIYIWEKTLSSDEEDPFESELVESMQQSFGFEPASVNETKKQGNDRAKINKSINNQLTLQAN